MEKKLEKIKKGLQNGVERLRNLFREKPFDAESGRDKIVGFRLVIDDRSGKVFEQLWRKGTDGKPREVPIGLETGLNPKNPAAIEKYRARRIKEGLMEMNQ